MPVTLTWYTVVLRLGLDALAAAAIGLNRDEHGRPAGLRTNLLVSLAACIAMIQTNALINSTGKALDSFVVMDIMRLPLGILSGIGFIGAGAIIKRGEMVVGVTTAATLWFVTVMGLCFGGGQIGLGIAAFALGYLTLAGLKHVEIALPQEHRGTLKISVGAAGLNDSEIESLLRNAGLKVTEKAVSYDAQGTGNTSFTWIIRWEGTRKNPSPPPIIGELTQNPQIERLEFST